MMAYLDEYSFRPKLHRWRFDLRPAKRAKSGSTIACWNSA
jgi:hypothetical protein